MYNDPGTTVIRKRLSFFSVLALSLAAIVMTSVISAAGIGVYGLRLIDKKSDGLIGLIEQAVKSLPEYREALPPILADALDDERRPDYVDDLRVSVHLGDQRSDRGSRMAVVEIENLGDQIVSALSMRIVGLDESGDPVLEQNIWAARPIQIEETWRGPLLPRATRRFAVRCWHGDTAVDVAHEITEIRLWRGEAAGKTETARAPIDSHIAELN